MKTLTIVTVAIMGISLSSAASAAFERMFEFYQGGFSEGAYVSGTFSGADLNASGRLGDDQLPFLPPYEGEVSSFHMSFSGNSLVSSFNVDYPIARIGEPTLVYDMDGGPLGEAMAGVPEGIALDKLVNTSFEQSLTEYWAGAGPLLECATGGSCGWIRRSGLDSSGLGYSGEDFSKELVQVNEVPLPAAVWLFGSGLLGLLFTAKRNKKRA